MLTRELVREEGCEFSRPLRCYTDCRQSQMKPTVKSERDRGELTSFDKLDEVN